MGTGQRRRGPVLSYRNMQEESVYCLIPPVIEPPPKPPLYRSRYPGTVPSNKKSTATMGPLKVPAPDPHKYLKAYTREDNKLPEPRKCDYRMPPSASQRCLIGVRSL